MMGTFFDAIHAGSYGWGGGFPAPWMFLPALFWMALLGFIAWVVARNLSARREADGGNRGGAPAEEILRERFARGEMGAEEYQRAIETLRASSTRSRYEDYVREAEEDLRAGRNEDS